MTTDETDPITALQQGTSDAAVLKTTTDRATIEAVTSTDGPRGVFPDAVADDDIAIAGERGRPAEGIKWVLDDVLQGPFI